MLDRQPQHEHSLELVAEIGKAGIGYESPSRTVTLKQSIVGSLSKSFPVKKLYSPTNQPFYSILKRHNETHNDPILCPALNIMVRRRPMSQRLESPKPGKNEREPSTCYIVH